MSPPSSLAEKGGAWPASIDSGRFTFPSLGPIVVTDPFGLAIFKVREVRR